MIQFGEIELMREAASSLFVPLHLTASPDIPFHVEVTDASVGPVKIVRMSNPPGQVRRLPRLIRSDDRRMAKVILQHRGNGRVVQGDRRSRVGPGDMTIYDTNQPYDLHYLEEACGVIIMMPWEMLGPSGDLIVRRTGISVPSDRGIRSVIATFFNGLADTALSGDDDELRTPDAFRLADTAASLLITGFAGTPCERTELPTCLADRILSYALATLHDPGLSVGSVARRFGISPRYLHALMRGQDVQFGAWVRRERLKRIRQDLLDPRLANLTAAAIAARWGIPDPNHLSRSLRAEFGQSAAEIRAQGRQAT